MKRIIKNNIFGFVMSAILLGGISTVVATSILSNNVSYQNNNQESVKTALDDIYSYATNKDRYVDINSVNLNGTGGKVSFVYWNDNLSNTTYTSIQVPTGSGLNGTYAARELLATAYSNWENAPVYIKTTKVNGTVTGHAACLWYNNREFCIAPNYWDTNASTTMTKLKADMENALGITSNCNSNTNFAYCFAGTFLCNADANGLVYCRSDVESWTCIVYGQGNARCS